jgi:hypothetical protein
VLETEYARQNRDHFASLVPEQMLDQMRDVCWRRSVVI